DDAIVALAADHVGAEGEGRYYTRHSSAINVGPNVYRQGASVSGEVQRVVARAEVTARQEARNAAGWAKDEIIGRRAAGQVGDRGQVALVGAGEVPVVGGVGPDERGRGAVADDVADVGEAAVCPAVQVGRRVVGEVDRRRAGVLRVVQGAAVGVEDPVDFAIDAIGGQEPERVAARPAGEVPDLAEDHVVARAAGGADAFIGVDGPGVSVRQRAVEGVALVAAVDHQGGQVGLFPAEPVGIGGPRAIQRYDRQQPLPTDRRRGGAAGGGGDDAGGVQVVGLHG